MTVKVHRLMAYQKFGDAIFKNGIQVRHLNGNSQDNSDANITIGTQAQNIMDRSPESRHTHAVSAGRSRSHLSDEDILEMRNGFSNGKTLKWAMKKYNIAKATASYIKNRKTYKYL